MNNTLHGNRTTQQHLLPSISDLNIMLEIVICLEDDEYNVDDMVSSMAEHFCINREEAHDHLDTAEYLSLVSKVRPTNYILAQRGVELFNARVLEERVVLAKAVVNSWIFVELVNIARRTGSFDEDDIDKIIAGVHKAAGTPRYTSTTIGRRRQTIVAWLKWLTDEIGCFERDGHRYSLK